MNIFVLDLDVKKCAQYHCDKHLVKMITEHNQILGSIAYTARGIFKKQDIRRRFILDTFADFPRRYESGEPYPYSLGYKNHPCTRWAASSLDNYLWLTQLTKAMCKEYTRRYKKIHAGEAINNWYTTNRPSLLSIGLTPFAQVVPLACRVEGNAVAAYRNYYIKYKSQIAVWAHSPRPSWYKSLTLAC